MSSPGEPNDPLSIIGWREWVSLPDLGIPFIKSKVDTGAKSSSLHALEVETHLRDETEFVRFVVPPYQRSERGAVTCDLPLHDRRVVRSSSGEAAERFVIRTTVKWKGRAWLVDVTLADRTKMAFRMLLGRETLRGRVLVDSDRSFCGGRPRRKKKL
ncbi:MAG: RimK/LysX family protein [Planctomycetota bacterium]